jgi:hypothetical protein
VFGERYQRQRKLNRNHVIDSDEENADGILDNGPPDFGANGVENPPSDFQLGR